MKVKSLFFSLGSLVLVMVLANSNVSTVDNTRSPLSTAAAEEVELIEVRNRNLLASPVPPIAAPAIPEEDDDCSSLDKAACCLAYCVAAPLYIAAGVLMCTG